ncbi:SdpI/YhfL protein family protein [Mucilaginibacter lappiensis]|nr:SdpI/YhfL protein family protein [Mucilaginibacter lappiensis]
MVGVILLLLGCIFHYYPPKHINKWYGYKMPSALKNQKTWDEANRYSAIYMVKIGIFLVIAGLLVTFILNEVSIPARLKEGLTALFLIASGPITGVYIIVSTENHLEKIFHKEQK